MVLDTEAPAVNTSGRDRLPHRYADGSSLASREARFLLEAIRRFFDPQLPLDVPDLDWDKLRRLAEYHKVTPMLYAALRGSNLPSAVLSDLAADFEGLVWSSLAQTAELVALAGVLEEHGIYAVVLKGPALSSYLYLDPSVRSSTDIDFLVPRNRVIGIRDILLARGYSRLSTLHWNSDSACLRSRENQIPFMDPSGIVGVDVQWCLMPPYFANPFDGLEAEPSLTTVKLAGREVRTLAPEPLLLYLCSHGAKHAFECLAWICDIASLLRLHPNLDWTATIAQAARTHASRQLWLGVQLAVDLLDAPRPPGMPEDPAVQALAHRVTNRMLSGATTPMQGREALNFTLQVLERPRQRIRYLAGTLLVPSAAEYGTLRLPPWLFFLYYPLRTIRLAARAAFHPFAQALQESGT